MQRISVALRSTATHGFKAFHSAAATLTGIETADMIRKGQCACGKGPKIMSAPCRLGAKAA